MSRIVLAGFDIETARKLALKIASLHHQPELFSGDLSSLARNLNAKKADLVFLSGDDVRCQRSLAALTSQAPDTPVIVAGRAAEDAAWLLALEAGATDYCSVDEDPANLAWMLANALHQRAFAGAA